ncbi:MAG: AI-2E family transporter [Chitinophagales bacterium]
MNNSKMYFQQATYALLFTALILAFLILAKSVLVPLMISILLALLFIPVCSWMENKLRFPRATSAALVVVGSLILIVSILMGFVKQIVSFKQDMEDFDSKFSKMLLQFKTFIQGLTGTESMAEISSMSDAVEMVIQQNTDQLASSVFTILGSVIWFIIVPIFIFLMLIYRGHFKQFLVMSLSVQHPEDEKKFDDVISKIKKLVQSYISGMFIVMLILAIINTGILYLCGIEHAIFFGIFAALLNIVPYIGPQVGALTAALYTFITKDNALLPVIVYGAFQLVQLIESNILTPRIVGHKVSINPLITMLAIIIGGLIWDVAGMILIIPVLAILKEVFMYIPNMQPFAFLIGNVSTGDDREMKFVSKQFEKVVNKLPKKN